MQLSNSRVAPVGGGGYLIARLRTYMGLATVGHKLNRLLQDFQFAEIAPLADPRSRSKALIGNKQRLWRYRIGDTGRFAKSRMTAS